MVQAIRRSRWSTPPPRTPSLNGTGGTVVGAAVQETPPKWVQLSAVTSPDLAAPHLININQAALYRFDGDSARLGRVELQ
ncbi:hypothetical protein ACFQ51_53560 [Streptomyces kaempferi]